MVSPLSTYRSTEVFKRQKELISQFVTSLFVTHSLVGFKSFLSWIFLLIFIRDVDFTLVYVKGEDSRSHFLENYVPSNPSYWGIPKTESSSHFKRDLIYTENMMDCFKITLWILLV